MDGISNTARFDGMMQIYGMMASRMGETLIGTGMAATADVNALYARDGIARVICNRPAEDAVASGWDVEVDDGEGDGSAIANELERLHVGQVFTTAGAWCRKDGAAFILILAKDGGLLTSPLNLRTLDQILALVPYPIAALNPLPDLYTDPNDPRYGTPVGYVVTPRRGNPFDVHESRILPFAGEPVPFITGDGSNIPWMGFSELEACAEDLANYRAKLRLAKAIMVRKQQAVHGMQGLGDMLVAGQEGVVRTRLDLADAARNLFNTVGIDAEDEFKVIDTQLGGVDAVTRLSMVALATCARMPMSVLFGEDIKGLGSTGTGEQSIYHGLLRQIQNGMVRPALERLLPYIWAQRQMPEQQPQKWRVVFKPLWSPSITEKADAKLKEAQAFAQKITALTQAAMGFITPDEARDFLARTEPEMEIEPDSPAPEMPDNTGEGEGGSGAGSEQRNAAR